MASGVTPEGLSIRRMRLADLETVLGWAAEEGWNPGVDDAPAFLAADPEGFFIGEVDGEPVAAISVVNHSDAFAFLGLYLCRPAYRGRGIGHAVWRHAIGHAGDRCVGLDGVPAQQGNYQASGFVAAGSTLRFEGVIEGKYDPAIRPAGSADHTTLDDLEEAATGYRKTAFNAHWLVDTATRKTSVLAENSATIGFATHRRCERGYKVGPVVAADTVGAIRLIRHVAAQVAPESIIIDVPEHEAALCTWCRSEGMSVSFNTARMYRTGAPSPRAGVHTVSTLEIG